MNASLTALVTLAVVVPARRATMDIDQAARLTRVRELVRSGAARAIRQAAGLSYRETAAPVGVEPSTILRWERGERVPHGKAALRYGELLDALIRRGQPR